MKQKTIKKQDNFMIILYCVTIIFFSILYCITLYNCDMCSHTQTQTITETVTKEVLIEKEVIKEVLSIDLLLNSIDKIKKDCGSTQLVKKYGSNEWSAFVLGERRDEVFYNQLRECYKQ